MRQTSGSMLCPSCRKLISVSEPKCPFCGTPNPSLFGYAPGIQRLVTQHLDFTRIITITCVGLYVAALVLQPEAIAEGFQRLPFGLLAPGSRALVQLGMTSGEIMRAGWWWTLLTAIYLHGGLLHIFFNLMWVRDLGPAVGNVFGPARAFLIFSFAGAIGFVVSNLASGNPTVGASGSIFGLLAALIVYSRRTGSPMSTQLWQWAGLMFVMGFLMSSVNNWAHAGGFAGGWIMATVMPASHEKRESLWIQIAALALLAITLLGFVMSFINVTRMLLGS
ncbi:MAG: rhomboid family intramembrane serine protease [Candidatus Eisenbacteria bacterium]|uniref:Rhomboid family intramembrane serine protease n=1 Tax=Eiseniibacteriota bacterium TaxID=2212470 RepID=A0A849SP44_UNCEI|nr:rhomboid family intramembrane serine protease [Candidatus Eisenbacteria bacterium]